MNSFLLVCDVFLFVFWKNPRPEKNVSRLSDLQQVRYILTVTLPSLNAVTHVHKYKKLLTTKAYFQGQFCNICKCPDAHFYYIKIRIAKKKKKSFFWLSDLSSKIVFKFAVLFRYWSLQATHSYLENRVYAPTYLLLPLGKRGSKWGDFHWAMGCV